MSGGAAAERIEGGGAAPALLGIPGLVYPPPAAGSEPGIIKPQAVLNLSAFSANPELLVRLMASGAYGRSLGGAGDDAAAAPAAVAAMFEQMCKGGAAAAPGLMAAGGAVVGATRADKFYVVREVGGASASASASVLACVEGGPIDCLEDAYAALQRVKARHAGAAPDTRSLVSLRPSTSVWAEPGCGPFFVVQMPPSEMESLRKAGGKAGSGAAAGGAARRGAASSGRSSDAGAGGSPSSSHHHTGNGGYNPGSRHELEPRGRAAALHAAVAAAAAGGNSSRTGSQLTGVRGGGSRLRGDPSAAAPGCAGARSPESPGVSDYSVNRGYSQLAEGGGRVGADAACVAAAADDIQEDEELALAAIMDLKQAPSGGRGCSPDGRGGGTPPSSDGTRAYVTVSSDDEHFHALIKHPPKRRRSAYAAPAAEHAPAHAAPQAA